MSKKFELQMECSIGDLQSQLECYLGSEIKIYLSETHTIG